MKSAEKEVLVALNLSVPSSIPNTLMERVADLERKNKQQAEKIAKLQEDVHRLKMEYYSDYEDKMRHPNYGGSI